MMAAMGPPFVLADPPSALALVADHAEVLGLGPGDEVERCVLVDARLRELRGQDVGWVLYSVASATVPDALVVVEAAPALTVWRFPDDPDLPAIAAALREGQDAIVVRYRPRGGCTLREPDGAGGHRFRKFLAGGRARAVAERHAVLWEAARRDPRLVVPEPLGAEADGSSYALRGATGVPLAHAAGTADAARLAVTVAGLLAALHAVELVPDRRVDVGALVVESRKKAGKMTRRLPDAAERLAPLLVALAEDELRPAPGPGTLVHGDLNAGQLLVDGEHVTLLDFDSLSRGDAEVDLAELTVDLCLGGDAAARALAGAIVGAYEHPTGRPLDTARLRLHGVVELLIRAWRHQRQGAPGWDAALLADLDAWPAVEAVLRPPGPG